MYNGCSAAYAEAAKNYLFKTDRIVSTIKRALWEERCVLWNKKYYSDMLHEAKISDYIILMHHHIQNVL